MKKLIALMMALCLMLTAAAALAVDESPVTDSTAQFYALADVTEDATKDVFQANEADEEDALHIQISWTLNTAEGYRNNGYVWDPSQAKFVPDFYNGVVEWTDSKLADVTVLNRGTRAVKVRGSFAGLSDNITGRVGNRIEEQGFVELGTAEIAGFDGTAALADYKAAVAAGETWEFSDKYCAAPLSFIVELDNGGNGFYSNTQIGTVTISVAFDFVD